MWNESPECDPNRRHAWREQARGIQLEPPPRPPRRHARAALWRTRQAPLQHVERVLWKAAAARESDAPSTDAAPASDAGEAAAAARESNAPSAGAAPASDTTEAATNGEVAEGDAIAPDVEANSKADSKTGESTNLSVDLDPLSQNGHGQNRFVPARGCPS